MHIDHKLFWFLVGLWVFAFVFVPISIWRYRMHFSNPLEKVIWPLALGAGIFLFPFWMQMLRHLFGDTNIPASFVVTIITWQTSFKVLGVMAGLLLLRNYKTWEIRRRQWAQERFGAD